MVKKYEYDRAHKKGGRDINVDSGHFRNRGERMEVERELREQNKLVLARARVLMNKAETHTYLLLSPKKPLIS